MATVDVTWLTQTQNLVGGSVYTRYRISLIGPEAVPPGFVLLSAPKTYSFLNVSAGTYTARVEVSDATGTQLGPGAQTIVTVPVSVAVDVPISIVAGAA